MSKPVQFQAWPDNPSVPYGPYRAVTERVVDGNTVHVLVSLGVDEYACRRVCIRGVNAPKMFSGPPRSAARPPESTLSGSSPEAPGAG